MNPFMMQQDIPKIPDLWKNEVNKYRLWIILFFIGIFVISSLSLVSIILNGLGMTGDGNIIKKYMDALNNAGPRGSQLIGYNQARLAFLTSMIIMPTAMLSLVIVSMILSIVTVTKSYKHHNFGKLSWAGIFIIQLSAFFALINIVQFFIFGGGSSLNDLPGAIYSLVVMFLYIPIWYFANRVSGIRKLFLLSERMEKLKNDPNYQNMKAQMNAFTNGQNQGRSPFGFKPTSNYNPSNNTKSTSTTKNKTSANNKTQNTASTAHVSETDKQLSKLSIKQLRAIAQKLFISGYETMLRPELILSIKRATQK